MGGLFIPAAVGAGVGTGAFFATRAMTKKPKSAKAPPPPAPIAVPEVDEEVGEIARRRQPRGRRETFLTGDLVPETEKKRLLG